MKFTFYSLGEDDSTYYGNVCNDFQPHVSDLASDITFDDDGTFTVEVGDNFLKQVFYQPHEDGSGLCQNYALVVE